MGLDMYIYKNRYYGTYSGDDSKEKLNKVRDIVGDEIDSFTTNKQVAYWRKANAIHHWFEVKVAGRDIENCEEIQLTKDNLIELIADCKAVLKNKKLASEILPTESGFFFGSTEYDDAYFDDLKSTIEMCQNIVDTWDDDCSYRYNGWW